MNTTKTCWWLAGVLAGTVACNGTEEPDPTPDAGTADKGAWEKLLVDMPAAFLSIWGSSSSDIWLAGADPHDGLGPMAMHYDGSNWTRLETGVDGDLWWVFSRDGDTFWFTGQYGLIVRYHEPTKTFTPVTGTSTTVTLYGIWGAPTGPLYAVGGNPLAVNAEPTIMLIESETATTATVAQGLPPELPSDEIPFKAWGTTADDVWVIGNRGSVMRRQSGAWSMTVLPGKPRLVTIHGSDANDMVLVGGATQAVVFERNNGQPWENTSPMGQGPLSGIYVTSSGTAYAAGQFGTALERKDGFWRPLEFPEPARDWHAVWVDELGRAYVAGGRLLTVDRLEAGTVLRWDPEATR